MAVARCPMLDVAVWTLIALLVAQGVVHRRLLSDLWARMEDPRSMAVLRIATGILVLLWIYDLIPLLETLYSSEGLFTGAQARRFWGAPGRVSLLFTYDGVTAVHLYAAALALMALGLTLGLLTPLCRWATFILFTGLVARNGLVIGGEQIFAFTLLYLALSDCGQAYSVDVWWRRRRDPDAPMQAIPAWPRMLVILQMIPVFCANGLAKSGRMWRDGDTFHYVVNHPHFRPTEVYGLSALFGTNLFRVMTWVTHAFEILFPLVVVGLVARGAARTSPDRWPAGRAKVLSRLLSVAIGATVVALALLRLTGPQRDRLPFVLSVAGGVAIAAGPVLVALARRVPPRVLRWVLGRRLWVSLWVLFTAQLAFVLDIGRFTALTLCLALAYFDGEPIGRALAWIRRRVWSRTHLRATPVECIAPKRSVWRHRAAVLFSVVHIIAVLAVVLPTVRPVAPWRRAIERPLWGWIRLTTLTQYWRMFAPNGPRKLFDIEVMVVDARGGRRSLGSGLLDPGQPPSAWGRNKREKLRRRLAGPRVDRFWPGYVRWVCRHHGLGRAEPVVVQLHRVTQSIPSPRALAIEGVEESLARVETKRRLLFEEQCQGSP